MKFIDFSQFGALTCRQWHKSFFEKSDLVFLCRLRPLSFDIQKQDLEIEAAQVIPGSVMWQQLIHDNILAFNILVSSIVAFLELVFKVKHGKLMQFICFALSESICYIQNDRFGRKRNQYSICPIQSIHSMFWC